MAVGAFWILFTVALAVDHQKCKKGLDCTDTNGQYCHEQIDFCLDTPEGRMATADERGYTKCPKGTMAETKNSLKCKQCARGKWEPELGQSKCNCIPEGYERKNDDAAEIQKCPAGTHNPIACNPGISKCTLCDAGKISKVAGSHHCDCASKGHTSNEDRTLEIPCGAGFFAPEPCSDQCFECRAGKFSTTEVNDECYCASAGHHPSSDRTGEVPCKAGHFQDEECKAECKKCGTGNFTSVEGSHACHCASAGHHPNGAGTHEIPCQPGHFQGDECMASCKKCTTGKFTSTHGSHACECAAAGHYPDKDSTKQVPCAAGRYQDEKCKDECKECAAGKYTNVTGSHECHCSPAGHHPSKDRTHVVPCTPGHHNPEKCAPLSFCHFCQPGKFARHPGSHHCNLAGRGHTVNSERTRQIPCGPGKFSDKEGAAECDECQAGRFSTANVTSTCEMCRKGYYQDDTGSTDCEVCRNGGYSDEEGLAQCKSCGWTEFSDTHGPATRCNKCYTFSNSFGFEQFSQCQWPMWGVFVLLAILGVGSSYIWYKCIKGTMGPSDEARQAETTGLLNADGTRTIQVAISVSGP